MTDLSGSDKERRHIGLLLAKEQIFREAAEEMLAVLPQVANVPSIAGPKSIRIPTGFMGWDGKKEAPEPIKQWAADTAKKWIGGKVTDILDGIGYDFGRLGAHAVYKDRGLSQKFYKDFAGASYYAGLDEEKVRALGHNSVAIIVEGELNKIIASPSFADGMQARVAALESKQVGPKVKTMIPTYQHIAEAVIKRIDDYRMQKTESLYRPEPVVEPA